MSLDEPLALDVSVVGTKAANLARAAGCGIPVLPGFVITTVATSQWTGAPPSARATPMAELRAWWARLSMDGARPLVVRSSSPTEDGETSSMAGRYTSVVGVAGWRAFLDAVGDVIASAATLGSGDRRPGPAVGVPMAVLVQPHLTAATGGVLFGADPVTGRLGHLVVAAVEGGPDRLVSGEVDGTRHTLSRRGRLLDLEAGNSGGTVLPARHRRALARLGGRVAAVFGGPQDVEWAIDGGGALWLLQSRPVTAMAVVGEGPVLGPGPVAETFPGPLSDLEQDLWLEPLREAMRHAVALSGAMPRRRVQTSPVVVAVDGVAAADLELLGATENRRGLLRSLDPRSPARRLFAAWRTGRLRVALPALARDVITTVDVELRATGPVGDLATAELMALLRGCRRTLVALHGNEILMGMLLDAGAEGTTAASEGLRALAAGRAAGLSDDQIVARHPVVLTLVAPAVRPVSLPEAGALKLPPPPSRRPDEAGRLREQLRLRSRWVQELSSRAALELGRRLAAEACIPDPDQVRWLTSAELEAVVAGRPAPADLPGRPRRRVTAPLPARFRLAADGSVVAVESRTGRRARGQGAGGGRGMGPAAVAGEGRPPAGSVLVVRNLSPGLAAVLPGLNGLVAETGSVLSHLAILARELGVPTVVGVVGAVDRFPPGTVVVVDGTTGDVHRHDEVQAGRDAAGGTSR